MKVKLYEVLEALEGAGMDENYYYETKNQERYLMAWLIKKPILNYLKISRMVL